MIGGLVAACSPDSDTAATKPTTAAAPSGGSSTSLSGSGGSSTGGSDAVTVGSDSEYKLQKSIAFKNPTAFPGLGKEAVIGKNSDETGAQPGLLYRTGGAMVYITGESDLTKLAALGTAIAAQG